MIVIAGRSFKDREVGCGGSRGRAPVSSRVGVKLHRFQDASRVGFRVDGPPFVIAHGSMGMKDREPMF